MHATLPYDSVIFDLDGTLVDTADDLTASLNHALVRMGRAAVPEESVRAMVGHGARKLLERGLAATGEMTPALVEEGVPLFLSYYAEHICDRSRPFPGAAKALEELESRGLKLAICTNKPEALALLLLRALGWEGRFRAVKGADSQPWRKPDPRHLTGTLEAAGGRACIFVGDSRTDADTAVAAGAPLVMVSFGYSLEPVEELPAARLIHHFDALIPAIDDIQAGFTASGYQSAP